MALWYVPSGKGLNPTALNYTSQGAMVALSLKIKIYLEIQERCNYRG